MDVKQSFSSQGYFLGVYIIFFTLTSLYAQEKKILWKEFTSYYENGLLHERGQLISEKKSGTWITYSIQGKIQSLYNFTNDVKSGQYAEWDVYGRLTREGQFNNNEKCGIEYIYEEAQISMKITWLDFKSGKRKEESYDKNGFLRKVGFYKSSSKDSCWIYFAEDGKISALENYKNGQRNGEQKRYYPNNTIAEYAEYKNGLKHGRRLLVAENGDTTLFGVYNNDERSGYFIEQTTLQVADLSNDIKSYFVYGNYNNDFKEGTFLLFYSKNKKACSECYAKGTLNGRREIFYENGNLMFECTYHDNKKTGRENIYYPDGQLKKRSEYKNGFIDGEQIYFYENGRISERAVFSAGKLKSFTRYKLQGKPVK